MLSIKRPSRAESSAVRPTFLTLGAVERLGCVLLALAGLWLAIAAVLGWVGGGPR
jgi:hypothetical protein